MFKEPLGTAGEVLVLTNPLDLGLERLDDERVDTHTLHPCNGLGFGGELLGKTDGGLLRHDCMISHSLDIAFVSGSQVGIQSPWTGVDGWGPSWTRKPCTATPMGACGTGGRVVAIYGSEGRGFESLRGVSTCFGPTVLVWFGPTWSVCGHGGWWRSRGVAGADVVERAEEMARRLERSLPTVPTCRRRWPRSYAACSRPPWPSGACHRHVC